MFNIIEYDILRAVKEKKIQHFAHGANCWSTMGAGIADKVRTEMPELYKADCEFHLTPEQRLGRISQAELRNGVRGYNLYTQYNPGPNARSEMLRSSLTLALEDVAEDLVMDETVRFGIPAIGCGIGGLEFIEVARVIHEVTHVLRQDYPGRTVEVWMFVFPGAFKEDRVHTASQGYAFEVDRGEL